MHLHCHSDWFPVGAIHSPIAYWQRLVYELLELIFRPHLITEMCLLLQMLHILWSVYLFLHVGHTSELCECGWTDWDAVYRQTFMGQRNHVLVLDGPYRRSTLASPGACSWTICMWRWCHVFWFLIMARRPSQALSTYSPTTIASLSQRTSTFVCSTMDVRNSVA